MSSVDDFSQQNWLTTTSQVPPTYSVKNYATLGLSIAGTITTGTFTVEVSTDGSEWEETTVAKSGSQLADNEITETGSFIAGVAGYTLARLVPNTFTGSVQVTANISTRITPAFTVGF